MNEKKREAIRLAIITTQALGTAVVKSLALAQENGTSEDELMWLPRASVETMAEFSVSLKGFLEDILGEE